MLPLRFVRTRGFGGCMLVLLPDIGALDDWRGVFRIVFALERFVDMKPHNLGVIFEFHSCEKTVSPKKTDLGHECCQKKCPVS
jgi:hypothetical protein